MNCDKKSMLLYAVTDRAWVGRQSLYEQVESALKGGASCVQLREKELDEEEFLKEAMELSALCRKYGVPFFINDNVEIAIKCHADGIHVGQEDMEAAKVRQKVGDDMMITIMADEKVLQYKGRPLMRKDNMVYYGSMADSHIVMLQILETKKMGDMDVATRVSVQLQLTDPTARSRDRIVKKSEKDGFYTALDLGCVWLERALAGK